MPRKLTTVRAEFLKQVRESQKLASDAYAWSIASPPTRVALISAKRRDSLTELAFFRVFSSWEAFLERTFILYMLGQQAPSGRKTHRFGFPPNESAAYEWVADGREYANWTPEHVKPRAKRLFRDGRPFDPALTSHHNLLFQMKIVRNAIAHESAKARQKFEVLVRNELGALPPDTTVGNFLLTVKPRIAPPQSFLEFYLGEITKLATEIVPN